MFPGFMDWLFDRLFWAGEEQEDLTLYYARFTFLSDVVHDQYRQVNVIGDEEKAIQESYSKVMQVLDYCPDYWIEVETNITSIKMLVNLINAEDNEEMQ